MTSAISFPQTATSSTSVSSDPQKWCYLIPTIGAVAIGILFAPNFAVGLAAGALMGTTVLAVSLALSALGLTKEDTDSEYGKDIDKNPLTATILAPVLEELLFRGAMQAVLTQAIIWLVPTAAATFLGTGLAVATTVSIVATAAIFGLAHLYNEHENSHIQAILATGQGIALGVLTAQFGLGASIAAHMVVNTIGLTLRRIFSEQTETQTSSAQNSLLGRMNASFT